MAVFNNFHNEQILKLDVKQQQPNKIPRFVQYDSALLKIELYDNGKLYDVSRAENFVISAKRPDGSTISGLADFDGEFVNYKLSKQDLEILGETSARLQIYEGRHRLSSLSFRYDVYEDYETVGDPDDVTLLSALLSQVRDALLEAQRQGGYAENRGDFANVAGDYANSAGDSQKMRWLKWVKTVADRNREYPNPRNGDTVYVVNVSDKNGGAVYRYNGVNRPFKWEEISGWDTSIIQDIYNLIATKEDKTKVVEIVEELQKDLEDTIFGGRNIVPQTDTSIEEYDKIYRPVVASSEVQMINTGDAAGRVVQARLAGDTSQSYFGATVGNSSGGRFSVKEGEELVLSFKGITSLTATDFTYVYLMRPGGEGSNKSMTKQFVRDVDYTGYDKYEFTVTAPWTSDSAYLLIGSNKRSDYTDAGHPFWIRFKDVQLERGNRATDWKPAIEDIITNFQEKISDLREEMDGKFSKHSSRISVLEDKIQFQVSETVYDSDKQVIEEWQSNYEQTARQIQTTVSKKVGDEEIISKINQTPEKIKIQANKIALDGFVTFTDLETPGETTISGSNLSTGEILSSNGRTSFNLNTGELKMENADFTLSGGASIEFTNTRNNIFITRQNVTAGANFTVSSRSGYPLAQFGSTDGDTLGSNNSAWSGLIVSPRRVQEEEGTFSSITGLRLLIRDELNWRKAFSINLDGNNPSITPQNADAYDYDLGSGTNYFRRIYAQDTLVNTSRYVIRSAHDSNRGWMFDVEYNNTSSSWMHFRGLNAGSWYTNPKYYALGSSNAPFQRAFINSITENSDRKVKKNIRANELGLAFIKDVSTKSFTMKGIEENKVGVIAQELEETLKKHNVKIEEQSMLQQGEIMGVEYTQLISPTIKAVQELDTKVEEENKQLRAEVLELKGMVAELSSRIS